MIVERINKMSPTKMIDHFGGRWLYEIRLGKRFTRLGWEIFMRLGWENILRGSAGRFSQNDTFINIFGKYVSFTPNLPTSYVFGLFSQPSLVHYPVTGQKKHAV